MPGATSQGHPLASRRLPAKLSPREWAELIAAEAHALGIKMTPRQLAEGLGVLEAESNFNEWATSGGHIGPWEESSAFGSPSQRLDPRASTRAALQQWVADEKSWWPAWGNYEKREAEGPGPDRYKKFLPTAQAVLSTIGTRSGGTSGNLSIPGYEPATPTVRAGARGSESPGVSAQGESPGGDLMHVGLVGVLVLGGIGLMGFGATRMIGASKAAKAAHP